MTGSSLAPIVIPVVVVIVLAVWLIMVFHAASHPRWGRQAAAPTRPGAGLPGAAGQQPEPPRTGAGKGGTPPASLPSPASEPELPHAA
jgi:hypothetical protein